MKNLRNITFLALGAALLGLGGCNDDDSTSASLLGRWNRTQTTTHIAGQNPVSQPYAGNEIGCEKDYLEFADQGVLRDVMLYTDAQDLCAEDVALKSWAKDGDILTIDSNDEDAETFTVTRLTGSELHYTSTLNSGGVVITVTQEFRRR